MRKNKKWKSNKIFFKNLIFFDNNISENYVDLKQIKK